MSLPIGTKAPDFKLFNTEKKEISLSDYKGKNLVINFFPAAFTGVCTAQMCNSRDEMADYNSMNAEVIGVSTDSPFTLGVFKKQNNLDFELLSDYNKKMIHDYDMYQVNFAAGMRGVAKRGVMVVDKEGVIQYVHVSPTPGDQIHFEDLKKALSKLK